MPAALLLIEIYTEFNIWYVAKKIESCYLAIVADSIGLMQLQSSYVKGIYSATDLAVY